LQAAFDKKITADSRLKDFQAKFEALEKRNNY